MRFQSVNYNICETPTFYFCLQIRNKDKNIIEKILTVRNPPFSLLINPIGMSKWFFTGFHTSISAERSPKGASNSPNTHLNDHPFRLTDIRGSLQFNFLDFVGGIQSASLGRIHFKIKLRSLNSHNNGNESVRWEKKTRTDYRAKKSTANTIIS